MYPKEFIQQVFIVELERLAKTNPYITFALIAIGIEFLGKCLRISEPNWNKGRSQREFENAINSLDSLQKYRELLLEYKLWDSLRNGFAHSFVPKKHLSLSSKDEMAHLTKYTKNSLEVINLRCEDLYGDFRGACIEIINMSFDDYDKMNKPLITIHN